MSILPTDRAVKMYVGSWSEWMESVGVCWEDAEEGYGCPHIFEEGDITDYSDEKCQLCGLTPREIWPHHFEDQDSTEAPQ